MDQGQQQARMIEERRRQDIMQLRFGLLKLAYDTLKEAKEPTTPDKIKEWAEIYREYIKEGI